MKVTSKDKIQQHQAQPSRVLSQCSFSLLPMKHRMCAGFWPTLLSIFCFCIALNYSYFSALASPWLYSYFLVMAFTWLYAIVSSFGLVQMSILTPACGLWCRCYIPGFCLCLHSSMCILRRVYVTSIPNKNELKWNTVCSWLIPRYRYECERAKALLWQQQQITKIIRKIIDWQKGSFKGKGKGTGSNTGQHCGQFSISKFNGDRQRHRSQGKRLSPTINNKRLAFHTLVTKQGEVLQNNSKAGKTVNIWM